MTKQHFEAFAQEACEWRVAAHQKEQEAKAANDPKDKANLWASSRDMFTTALAIENTVIKVAKQFNKNFDVARFRQACNPDSVKQALDNKLNAELDRFAKASERLSGKRPVKATPDSAGYGDRRDN